MVPDPHALRDRVAVVAGSTHSDYDRPETIEETAELVTRLGETGVALAVDRLDSDAVKGLADWLRRTHGHIDVLVNDIWGADVLEGGPSQWNTPIWQHDLDKGMRIMRLGVDTHPITSHHLLPLLVSRPGGLAQARVSAVRDDAGELWRDGDPSAYR